MSQRIFYVSVNGDDSNSGSRESPFKSIKKARETAHDLNIDDARIEVMAGMYRETLELTSEDNGYTFNTDEGAVITGGLEIPYADLCDVPENVKSRLTSTAAAHVRMIDLNKYGINRELYDTLYCIGSYSTEGKYDDMKSGVNIEVFENDHRMSLARYPDNGYLKLEAVLDVGDVWEFPPQNYWLDWNDRRNHRGGTYIVDKVTNERLKKWKTPETAWIFGYFFQDWADSSTPVTINTKNRAILPKMCSRYGARAGALYYFYNVLEELDSPGEYYLDRENGYLYVYPHDESTVFSISLDTSPLIKIHDADNIKISGFTLTCTRGNAIEGNGNNIVISNLLIKNIASNAVVISGNKNRVENCEITHTGRGGISLIGGDRTTLTHGENIAINNYIHDFSEVYQTYQPGVSLAGVGNICSHNEISGSPHMAISYSGNEHLIEYNNIHDVVLHSSDAGAIYSGYNWTAHGTVIRYNLLRDIGSNDFNPDGIYWDDGLSGQTAYGNILINVKKNAFLIGGGRDNTVRDNIIIGESASPIAYDDRNRDGFVNGGWAHAACDTPDSPHWQRLKSSPYKSEIWTKKYPTLARVITDFSKFNDPDFPINPANAVIENNIIINEQARFGWMAQSVYEYNNIGENYTYHNFDEADFDFASLKFKHPRAGFPEIPVDSIGRMKE